MSKQIIAVIVGAVIGSVSSLMTTLLISTLSNRRRKRSIQAIAAAEITAIKEKAHRYIHGKSTADALRASTPMLTSIASELGYLSLKQAIAFRRAVTLDMEMRKTIDKEHAVPKASATIEACEEALKVLPVKMNK